VGHVTEGAEGRITEEQDIVYLDIPDRFRPPKPIPAPQRPDFDEPVEINEARLFRFSAATFNAHRIHYDLPYAREVEKYPGLVVHGPMQAAMLIECAIRHTRAAPARFSFRGVHPLFHGAPVRLAGRIDANAVELCTIAAAGHQAQQARMEWDG
jgi:3-methylfumaryl-CoA hydratase